MADLDEMSLMLGEIRADMRHALKWFDEHEKKDQERFVQLATRIEASNGVKARVEGVEIVVMAHQPIIDLVKNVKWAAVAFGTVVISLAGVAGSVGSFAKEWLFK